MALNGHRTQHSGEAGLEGTMDLKTLQKTAYHEAGHAVIGYRFGLRWGDMALKSAKENTSGVHRWFEVIDLKQRMLVLLAGHAAVMAFDPSHKGLPSISDYREVWRLCDSIAMTPGEYRKLFIEVDDLVAANTRQIQAVAEALLECGNLESGMYAIIIEQVDKGEDWRRSSEWIARKGPATC
jgi:hypothetical protein